MCVSGEGGRGWGDDLPCTVSCTFFWTKRSTLKTKKKLKKHMMTINLGSFVDLNFPWVTWNTHIDKDVKGRWDQRMFLFSSRQSKPNVTPCIKKETRWPLQWAVECVHVFQKQCLCERINVNISRILQIILAYELAIRVSRALAFCFLYYPRGKMRTTGTERRFRDMGTN